MLTTLNLLYGPLVAACAWYSFARALAAIVADPRGGDHAAWELAEVRRDRVRKASATYRYAEPLVRELVDAGVALRLADLDRVEKSLTLGGETAPWEADEYVAAAATEGVAAGFAAAVAVGLVFGGLAPLVAFPVVAVLAFRRRLAGLHSRARARVAALRRGLPYATDLLSLTMEAGAEFDEALAAGVETMAGSVVGEELHRVRRLMDRGESLDESLDQMQRHGDCEEVRDLVRAVKNARRLGAALSGTMLQMAEQMRLKRVQRAEEKVGKAQVQMTFPGILIMAACLLIVLTVFMLPAIYGAPLF